MNGKNNISIGFLTMGAFMAYGFLLIYLRDFAPGKKNGLIPTLLVNILKVGWHTCTAIFSLFSISLLATYSSIFNQG
jgi:hypothetical protein